MTNVISVGWISDRECLILSNINVAGKETLNVGYYGILQRVLTEKTSKPANFVIAEN